MALIGTISINMVARTEQMVRAMARASSVVRSFGAAAAGPLKFAGGAIAQVGVESARVAGVMGRMGGVGLRGAAYGFRLVGAAAGKVGSGLRAGVNALGGMQARVAALAAGGLLYKLASSASSLGEQTDRARVLFGPAADEITSKARTMGEAFGISRSEFVGAASEMGGMFKGMGYAAGDAAKMGAHFAALATDVASATQTSVPEAMERMRSGLAGESEAVRKWGVDLSEANLKIQAVRLGVGKMGAELNQSQKIQVRSILMDEALAYAKGNLAKTAGGAENAAKGLMGRLENLAATIGTALLPVVGSALSDLGTGVQALSMTWSAWTAGVVNDQVGVVGAVGETANSMGYLQKAVGFVVDSFQVLKIGFYLTQSYITSGIAALVQGFGKLGELIDYVVQKVSGKSLGIGEFLNTYSEDLNRISEKQYESYQQELMKAPASEGINAAFAAAQDRIKAMRGEAMKPGADVTKFVPKAPEMAPKAPGESKFASAMEAGSKEAANAVLRSRYGDAATKGPAEETARNTKETNRLLGQIAVNLGGGLGAMAGNALAANM